MASHLFNLSFLGNRAVLTRLALFLRNTITHLQASHVVGDACGGARNWGRLPGNSMAEVGAGV